MKVVVPATNLDNFFVNFSGINIFDYSLPLSLFTLKEWLLLGGLDQNYVTKFKKMPASREGEKAYQKQLETDAKFELLYSKDKSLYSSGLRMNDMEKYFPDHIL